MRLLSFNLFFRFLSDFSNFELKQELLELFLLDLCRIESICAVTRSGFSILKLSTIVVSQPLEFQDSVSNC